MEVYGGMLTAGGSFTCDEGDGAIWTYLGELLMLERKEKSEEPRKEEDIYVCVYLNGGG